MVRLKVGSEPVLPVIASPAPVETPDTNLAAALEHAFKEPPAPPLRRTKAIVIVRDGQVIAERYAPGVGMDTPLMGFSMTKSVTNALLGILARQGRLTPSQPFFAAAGKIIIGSAKQAGHEARKQPTNTGRHTPDMRHQCTFERTGQ